jgi:hypothetical protein
MQTTVCHYVQDINLAAALYAVGLKFMPDYPIQRRNNNGKELCYFNFQQHEMFNDFVRGWDKDYTVFAAGHPLNDPEHLFWTCKAALLTRERLLDSVKRSSTIHSIEKGGVRYIVTKNP